MDRDHVVPLTCPPPPSNGVVYSLLSLYAPHGVCRRPWVVFRIRPVKLRMEDAPRHRRTPALPRTRTWSLGPCTPLPSMASSQLRPQREDKELPQWQHHSPRGTMREPKAMHSVYALSEAARPLAEAGDVRRRLSRHAVTACPHKTFPIAVRTPCHSTSKGRQHWPRTLSCPLFS